MLGDVYLVVRTFPIRVGNTADGYSGDWLPDQVETSWEEIASSAGLDADKLRGAEKTTVTKRQRRVATFSDSLLKDAVQSNGATKLFVTFSEYIDGSASAGLRGKNISVSSALNAFIRRVERVAEIPVVGVSTGPDVDDMVEYEQ